MRSLAAGLAFSLWACSALAQDYPSRPVRIVIPLSPGGTTDVPGRIIAQKLSETLGQQFFVENRAGAGGTIGTDYVAKSRPDGYTLLLSASPFVIAPHVYKNMPYDALADFAPVIRIATGPYVLVVHPSLGVNSVKELKALGVSTAKRSPEMPDVPTIAEAGVPGYEALVWIGMLAPAGTPREIVAKLNGEIGKLMGTDEVKKLLAPTGMEPDPDTPAQFG